MIGGTLKSPTFWLPTDQPGLKNPSSPNGSVWGRVPDWTARTWDALSIW
jgi:hypothetical protein